MVTYLPYHIKCILGRRQHPDHWGWGRCSAVPYSGCEYTCNYCCSRTRRYCPFDDPANLGRIVCATASVTEG
jgi:hypothetical protein